MLNYFSICFQNWRSTKVSSP